MVVVLITAGCSGEQAEPTPTTTPIPPSVTPAPPTSTPTPPTPTPVPPTSTPIPPTATPVPPTATVVPPTPTPIPPTPTPKPLDLGEFETLFRIGQRDGSESEFSREFEGVDEYSCTVGVDCLASKFPQYHCRSVCSPSTLVKTITITFALDQDYSELVLRLAREGDETTEVTIDSEQTFLVTKEMLSSGEFNDFGWYDLELGSLMKGTHTILLTVADDGIDNAHAWDALALYGQKAAEGDQ